MQRGVTSQQTFDGLQDLINPSDFSHPITLPASPLSEKLPKVYAQSMDARIFRTLTDLKRPSQFHDVIDKILLLKYLQKRFDYTAYCEIGTSQNETFSQIQASIKVGVDPCPGGTHRMTSDVFFNQNTQHFDLIFIDGLHWSQQVIADVENSLAILNPGGNIIIHDRNPRNKWESTYPMPKGKCVFWNGDVWKAIVYFRSRPNLDTVVGDFDWGCGVIRVRPNPIPLSIKCHYEELTWDDLKTQRNELLRLMTFEELCSWLSGD